jgi:hypothetical protein
LKKNSYSKLTDIIGVAHRWITQLKRRL